MSKNTSLYKKNLKSLSNKPLIILGIHKDPWHNTGSCIIKDDGKKRQIAFLSEERKDRIKDSRNFPNSSIKACMEQVGIKNYDEFDMVVMDYIEKDSWELDQFKRKCRTDVFLKDLPKNKIFMVNHHLLHACAVYFSSGFNESAILIIDGRGSLKETQSLFIGEENRIKLLDKTNKIGIGLLYAAVTHDIGWKILQEGKTMGLAPYGQNIKNNIYKFPNKFKNIVTDYSDFCEEGSYLIKQKHKVPETFEDKAKAAFEVQEECEKAMLHLAKYAKKTGKNKLCISGGVGLNSVSNNKIRTHEPKLFDEIFINPAASDTGIPFGAALYGYHILANKPIFPYPLSPFLGPEYSEGEIKKDINKFMKEKENNFIYIEKNSFEIASKLLKKNFIVANFQGRSEMGPRALGNRSILMSPTGVNNKDRLNLRVKHRESFRPFAPAVLEERASEFFEIDVESPYMLFICDVKKDKRKLLPAITHVDGTARLQTLNRDRNAKFYDLVKIFGEETGVPVLLNTSFNVNGEPIVETPIDAIKCFVKTDIDALLIGDNILVKSVIDKSIYK